MTSPCSSQHRHPGAGHVVEQNLSAAVTTEGHTATRPAHQKQHDLYHHGERARPASHGPEHGHRADRKARTAWAPEIGYQISDRGRIHQSVKDAYTAAQ
ncbi:Lsr2 family DNA-binding protein [Kocuria turfanensis]|uniref:Lsr2 family DNA-binding protein n=1 Tax=Kocuria turfanensis TaxID=388357 RepID=UPI0011BEC770|nr:histone-like nucleoid-structuring protein Lsr2 [Kocuria turfanensis]